jgi:hypothetical protein
VAVITGAAGRIGLVPAQRAARGHAPTSGPRR